MADNTPIDIIHSRDYDETPRLDPLSLDQQQDSTPKDAESKDEQHILPDGGYGWVCVACVFWINAHTWGINSVSSSGSLLRRRTDGHHFPNCRAMASSSPTIYLTMYSPTVLH